MASRKFRLALIQFCATSNKKENLAKITKMINEACKNGANVLSLPECCNSPYGHQYFSEHAETIPGESTNVFSKAAADNKIYLIAGSIIERRDDKLYNTCTVFGPDGKLLSTYSKMHLFDVDVPGKISFQESKSLAAGNSLAILDLPFCRVGLGICYDIRFPEIAQLYAKHGCKLLMFCGAFNMTTGPAHWELLIRARALDSQAYLAATSLARDASASYVSYGHSMVVDPWAKVISSIDEKEGIIYADIDLDHVEEVRSMIPVLKQKREDLYKVESVDAINVFKSD